MANARQRAEWRRTATLCAIMAEPHRDSKKRSEPYNADTFDPFVERADVVLRAPLSILKNFIPGGAWAPK